MRHWRLFTGIITSFAVLFLAGCQEQQTAPTSLSDGGLELAEEDDDWTQLKANKKTDAAVRALMDDINASLEAEDAPYRAVMAEYITEGPNDAGNTVIAKNVGNKRLVFDFVPFDPNRVPWSGPVGGPTDDITFSDDFFQTAAVGPGPVATNAAIRSAMATWAGVSCSNIPITYNGPAPINIGLFETGVLTIFHADIVHAGWVNFLPFPILGVAITFGFVGVPPFCPNNAPFQDHNGDGRCDTAFREIYYSNGFPWAINANFDVETVALHEAGHGLSQGHFGKVFVDNNGNLKGAPFAVMNAVYISPRQILEGTDNGGHCANWANWPQN